jgi:Tol biopolymer transport system component
MLAKVRRCSAALVAFVAVGTVIGVGTSVPVSSAATARDGRIAAVDWDAVVGLSAIVLIPSDRLATNRNSKVIVSGSGRIEHLQWTPDGKTLVYGESTKKAANLYAVDVSTSKRRLLAANLPDINDGELSPSGTTVAFWRQRSTSVAVELVGIQGGPARKLSAGAYPAWSSDSSHLALLTPSGDLETIATGGSGAQTGGRIESPASILSLLSWAPDGRSILVVTLNPETFNTVVETLTPSGTVLNVLSKKAGLAAAWSPDGTQVAFADGSTPHRGTVVVANADGSDRRTIDSSTDGASTIGLAWAPDGLSLVTTNGNRARVVDADGSHAKIVAYPGSDHELDDPAWQPLP